MSEQGKQPLSGETSLAGGEPPMATTVSVGSQLAGKRQELGWTVEFVASRLNLAPRQIEALEADNLAALPGLASTRGFVRAYAKLLRIDPVPLVTRLAQESAPEAESIPLRRPMPAAPFAPVKLTPMRRGGHPARMWGLIGLAVLVVAAAGAWRAGMLDEASEGLATKLSTAASAPSASSTPSASPAPAAAGPAAQDAATVTTALPAPASLSQAASASAAEGASAAIPAGQAATPSAHAAGSAAPAANPEPAGAAKAPAVADARSDAAAQRTLQVSAREECWIEVRRADNTVVMTRTLSPGSTENLPISGAMTVVFGNAKGVDVSLAGKTLDVRTRARKNMSQLEI